MTGIDAISRCSRRAEYNCLPIIKPLKPLKPFKTMSRSVRFLIGLRGSRQSVGDHVPPVECLDLPKTLRFTGRAATGSMTRYDERHENLIRPDFQYIIRVTKKVIHHQKKKTKRRSGSLRRLTIRHMRHSTSKWCALPWSPVQGPKVHLEATARDLVASTLEKHGSPWPQTGSWTHGKTGT